MSKRRLFVLAVSTPIIAFAVIGGFLGQAMTRDDTYQHLRVFEDVVNLVLNNYVEEVDVNRTMRGAMTGLADGLDPDSAYLTPQLVRSLESNDSVGMADVGLDLTRQYYLRVVSARDGSPAAKAGIRPGDYVRAINNRPTRDMSGFEGMRLLRGAPGSRVSVLVIRGNAADPHVVELVRERLTAPDVSSKMADASTGYVRIAEFSPKATALVKQAVDGLTKTGASRFVVDVRSASRGDIDEGLAVARLFVKSGALAQRQEKGDKRGSIMPVEGDGTIGAPVAVLVDNGTAGPAEVLAAALDGNDRATLVGERTLGRAARQRLVKLPDGSGLWLTHLRYLTPKGDAIHEKGLEPDVEIEQPDVEFGAETPTTDATLQRALEHLSQKKAA
jgi:carboxyl-terminal processing protease